MSTTTPQQPEASQDRSFWFLLTKWSALTKWKTIDRTDKVVRLMLGLIAIGTTIVAGALWAIKPQPAEKPQPADQAVSSEVEKAETVMVNLTKDGKPAKGHYLSFANDSKKYLIDETGDVWIPKAKLGCECVIWDCVSLNIVGKIPHIAIGWWALPSLGDDSLNGTNRDSIPEATMR